jgi:hypothetical protein
VRWGAALAVLFIVGFEPLHFTRTALDGDDASYFAHAATLGLDLDLNYGNEIVDVWNAHRTIASHPVGTGLMVAPIMGAFGLIDRLTGHPVINDRSRFTGSWAWFGFLLAASLAFFAGTLLLHGAVGDVVPDADRRVTLLLILASGVLYYVLRRFTMAHAFEFAAGAALLRAGTGLWRAMSAGGPQGRWIVAAATAALLALATRPANLNLLVLPPALLLALSDWQPGALRAGATGQPAPLQMGRSIGLLIAATALAMLPLALFNLHFFGAVYPGPAAVYGEDVKGLGDAGAVSLILTVFSLLPNLVPLLVGPEFGLLFTNPVVVLGVPAVVLITARHATARRSLTALGGAVLLALVAAFSVALVLYWRTTASGYGYRYLLVLVPLGVLGSSMLLHVARQRGRRAFRVAAGALIVLGSVSLVSQLFFQANERLGTRAGVNSFGEYHEYGAPGYLPALAREVARPSAWADMAARRYLGMLAVAALRASGRLDGLDPDRRERVERRYGRLDGVMVLQTVLLLACWVGFGAHISAPASVAARPLSAPP